MRDILRELDQWIKAGHKIGLATVINTWGSAPRGAGAKLAFTDDGRIAGSVSGGCIEGAVIEEGLRILEGAAPKLLHFGVADETAWDVGLACGGEIDVFVEGLSEQTFNALASAYESDQLFAVTTVISGDSSMMGDKLVRGEGIEAHGKIPASMGGQASDLVQSQLAAGKTAVKQIDTDQPDKVPAELFIEIVPPAPTLVIIGGVHIAIALANIGKNLGFKIILIDPRRSFGSEERFPEVDHLIQRWPNKAFQEFTITPSTAVVLLTHDPKIDDPAIIRALKSPAFYIGALGSRATHAKRVKRLKAAGVSEDESARINGPIGLNIGARTPEEIAISIMAQVIEIGARSKNGLRN